MSTKRTKQAIAASVLLFALAGGILHHNLTSLRPPRGLTWDPDRVFAERTLATLPPGGRILLILPWTPDPGSRDADTVTHLRNLWEQQGHPVVVETAFTRPVPPAPPLPDILEDEAFRQLVDPYPDLAVVFCRVAVSTDGILKTLADRDPQPKVMISANLVDTPYPDVRRLMEAELMDVVVETRTPTDMSIDRSTASDEELFDSIYRLSTRSGATSDTP